MSNPIQQLKLEVPFALEEGSLLSEVVIAYQTFGKLNSEKDNVIFVCHALTANTDITDWWNGLYGSGNIFDPDKYFIICANNLGSPYGTISAKYPNPAIGRRYGLDFPFFTIRDTANLHIKLLERLGIEKVFMLIGGSCGGNISQEIAIALGNKIANLVLLCCAAVESAWAIAIHESQRIALRVDPTIIGYDEEAGKEGLKAARAIALPYYRSHISFKIRQSEDDMDKLIAYKAASYIDYQGIKFVNRFDTHCYYTLLNALDTHNLGRGRTSIEESLSMISANTLCIGFDTDLLVPTIEQQFLANHIPNAKFKEIDSLYGHDAFLIESEKIKEIIQNHIFE